MADAPISRIVSGGQTGVDRAALDFALAIGARYGGWCPRGGWAEDAPRPPGVLRSYPLLREAPDGDPDRRTAWNVRDSDATLIVTRSDPPVTSPGTETTGDCAAELGRPLAIVDPLDAGAPRAIRNLIAGVAGPDRLTLNVAGPRESEAPGIYTQARDLLERALSDLIEPGAGPPS